MFKVAQESYKQIIINIGDSKFQLINLTEPLKENTQVFPGDPKPKRKIFSSFKESNFQHYIYSVGDHNYHPHGDAPNHSNLGCAKKGFEFWNLEFVFNKACMIDLSTAKNSVNVHGIKYLRVITAKHILPYLHLIKENTALIFRTGYDKWLELNKKHQPQCIPYIDKSAVDIISEFNNLRVLGIDSLTIDKVGEKYAHQKFKNKLIVECLVHLYNIPKKHRCSFYLQTSPVAIVGATGGPVVAYVYIPLNKRD